MMMMMMDDDDDDDGGDSDACTDIYIYICSYVFTREPQLCILVL